MKIVRVAIILATLALAGFAGTSGGATVRGAACGMDAVARALSGSSGGDGTCRQ